VKRNRDISEDQQSCIDLINIRAYKVINKTAMLNQWESSVSLIFTSKPMFFLHISAIAALGNFKCRESPHEGFGTVVFYPFLKALCSVEHIKGETD